MKLYFDYTTNPPFEFLQAIALRVVIAISATPRQLVSLRISRTTCAAGT